MVGPSRPGERPYDIDNDFQYQDAWNAHHYPACTSQPEGRTLTHGRTFPSSVVKTVFTRTRLRIPTPRSAWAGTGWLTLPCLALPSGGPPLPALRLTFS